VFKRNFPIHKLFERSCELGSWRLTAHKIAEVFGTRLQRNHRANSVIDQVEHGIMCSAPTSSKHKAMSYGRMADRAREQ